MVKIKNSSTSIAGIFLEYLKETSKNLLDSSVDIIFEPEKIISQAGFTVKYPHITSLFLNRRMHNLKNSPNFNYKNEKIYLTEKGRIKIIKSVIREKNDAKKWDGKWRAIIFDIPEINRKERRFLRTELKWMKFRELQKSIWICPHGIDKELTALLKLWKIDFRGDVRLLVIDKITEDKDIKRYFKL